MKDLWSRKIYLQMEVPTEEDSRSLQERILQSLQNWAKEACNEAETPWLQGVYMDLAALHQASELSLQGIWDMTVTLAYDGRGWRLFRAEAGDTAAQHYGLCMDLGSTTMIMELVDLHTGEVLGKESIFNPQIAYGEDILTRIFYTKDRPEHRLELQKATASGIFELMKRLRDRTGMDVTACATLIVGGNTTMIHFLLGLDAFGVFQSPYAVQTLAPDICAGRELGIPFSGFVYCYPALANYLGGDVVSGIIATELSEKEEISVFLDIGTNGELIIGNKDFLMAGAGAAGPALEGGVVRTGMRAEEGAVDAVQTRQGKLVSHVIGEGEAKGICGSGIVDLIAELFLNGWMDLRGKLVPEKEQVVKMEDGLAVEYAPGLYFYENDIEEFLKTKAAAMTMVEYMMNLIGLSMEEVGYFHVAGAFGTHIRKESAVTIGMYPDLERERLATPGNTSLTGARKMLLNRNLREKAAEILERMEYVQFGAVDDFLHLMVAAQAVPHTDMRRYPSVERRLEERKKEQR